MSKKTNTNAKKISLYSGWFQNPINEKFKSTNFLKILDFYVINCFVKQTSYKIDDIKKYGWSPKVYKKNILKDLLFRNNQEDKIPIFFAKNLDNIQEGIDKLGMDKNFAKLNEEKILVYKGSNREIDCVLYHIRNSLAHGRFKIKQKNKEIFYVMESGRPNKKDKNLQLQARIILKETTLLQWIEIIKNPNKYEIIESDKN